METRTVVIILILAVVAWFLFQKAKETATSIKGSVKDTFNAGTAAAAGATTLFGALGKFFNSGSAYGGSSSSSSTSGMRTGDDLLVPSFADGATSGSDSWGGSAYSYDSPED